MTSAPAEAYSVAMTCRCHLGLSAVRHAIPISQEGGPAPALGAAEQHSDSSSGSLNSSHSSGGDPSVYTNFNHEQ